MKHLGIFLIGSLAALNTMSCGSSGDSATSTVNSIADIPAISTLVNTGSTTTSSLSKAIIGTPPLLKDINANNVDTIFWNGLLATIRSAGTATQAQIQSYWEGEGACRMAQTVGYSFQNILQGGTSLCYMQNMPNSANGISVVSGTVTNPALIFDQGATDKVIKVQVRNQTSRGGQQSGTEDIFIKVYGTASSEGRSGYAADLWFCSGANAVSGYEQIRMSGSAFTTTSVHSDFGNFVGTVSATLTTNTSGQLVFSPTVDRSATAYFGPIDGSFTFLGAVAINSSGLLTARDYQTGSFGGGAAQTNKHAIFANYSGNTMDTLRFSEASFALQDNFGGSTQSITDATEFQNDHYASVSSGSLLTTARSEDFNNAIYTGSTTTQTALLAAISNFSCSVTPDIIVAMDFSASGPQAVAAQCENDFANMNFCDGALVSAVRSIVFQSQASRGACSTSFCITGDDSSCQLWADEHLGNAQGITTANAQCSSQGCCTAQ